MWVKCLYCDKNNDALSTGDYCESCGKKLPPSSFVKPRRTLGGDMPGEEKDERQAWPGQGKVVSEGLFAAAVVHLFAGGAFLILGSPAYAWLGKVPEQFAPNVLFWTILPTLVVGGFGVLARWTAIPALGLAVAFAVLWVAACFVLHPTLAVGWLIVDLALFAMLGWALWRGLRPEKRAGG